MWLANARQGDIDDAIAKVDEFAYEKSLLINIGDEKGELLDAAVRRANPSLALELGTYCVYSSLRIARAAAVGQGVLRRALGRQRRSGAAYLGAGRHRRPGHLRRRHHR